MAKTNIKVSNDKGAPNASVMRTFSRSMMSLGTLKGARKNRFAERNKSSLAKKRSALRRLENASKRKAAFKLGKPMKGMRKGRR